MAKTGAQSGITWHGMAGEGHGPDGRGLALDIGGDIEGHGAAHPGAVSFARRQVLAGLGAGAAMLALAGCATSSGYSLVDVIRRLMMFSTQNAFARLTSDGGFYDNTLTRLALPDVFGSRGDVLQQILISAVFKRRLERTFNHFAEGAAYRAAPLVTDAVRMVGVENAEALIRGRPTGATQLLRDTMGGSLIEAMVPFLGDAMGTSEEPLVGQVLGALVGVDTLSVARGFAGQVDEVIWAQIGREESAIRANPQATGDPLLIRIFGA